MSLKHRISSPLEAGVSVLDAHQLPGPVTSALEHVSKRLSKKGLQITLAVIRREYQMPSSSSSSVVSPYASSAFTTPLASPVPSLVSSASTPARSTFAMSPVRTIKHLIRSNTLALGHALDKSPPAALDLKRSNTVSPTMAAFASDCASPWTPRWPLFSPTTPAAPLTPATPASLASTATTETSCTSSVAGTTPQSAAGFGIRLVHAASLSARDEQVLAQALERARRKFHLGPEWLSASLSPAAYGLNSEVMNRSLAQNEVVFSSDGTLTLVALDHLYTFRSALAAYARTQSPFLLEDAVDELRRLILAGGRRPLRKSRLVGAHGWMGAVDESALSDVGRMYRRAYGGPDGDAGLENDLDADINVRRPVGHDVVGALDAEADPEVEANDDGEEQLRAARAEEMRRRPTPKLRPAPSPKAPALKLCTTFEKKPSPQPRKPVEVVDDEQLEIRLEADDDEDDGDLTARPSGAARSGPVFSSLWGHGVSIDEVLSATCETAPPLESGERFGPLTPNGYDDISPVTRGEWSFFMNGDGFGGGKTVAVETC